VSLGILSSRWTPLKLPGLYAWHDFGDGDTVLSSISPDTPAADSAQVRRVLDRSGNGRTLDQTVSGEQPLYRHGAVNGRNAIESDGIGTGGDVLNGSFTEIFRNQGAGTVLAIARDLSPTGGEAAHIIFRVSTESAGFNRAAVLTRQASSSVFVAGGRRLDDDTQVFSSDTSDGNLHLFEGRFDWSGGLVQIILDGTAKTAANFSSGAGLTSDTASGAVYAPAFNWPGYLCELVWCRSLLAADERAQMLAYSRARWGTP
jgi:hypothetical protein